MRHESSRKRPPDSDLGGRTTRRHSPHTLNVIFPPEDGCIAMRLLSSARHKWPSKDDGRETLVDAAGAPPGFPLVPTP